MELFLAWALLASVQLAATMSPGPAFMVLVRNAMAYDRKIGVSTALGLALGVLAHVCFVLIGISYLIAKSVFLFTLIKYAGAAYLIYIGVKALRSGKPKTSFDEGNASKNGSTTLAKAVSMGFLTNLLNPKAVVFFTAVFTQFIDPSTSLSVQLLYGFTSAGIVFIWFAALAIILTNHSIKHKCMGVMHKVERLCGGLMIALGLKLALLK